jgi:hypothetical protein
MSKTLLRHTLIKKIIFDIFVETLFKVSHTTVTNIFYCEEDIFGVIKEQNYYLNNKYASHVQRLQIVIFYLFLCTYVFFVVEVSFYFFLYIVLLNKIWKISSDCGFMLRQIVVPQKYFLVISSSKSSGDNI